MWFWVITIALILFIAACAVILVAGWIAVMAEKAREEIGD